jgi:hypothetical protein
MHCLKVLKATEHEAALARRRSDLAIGRWHVSSRSSGASGPCCGSRDDSPPRSKRWHQWQAQAEGVNGRRFTLAENFQGDLACLASAHATSQGRNDLVQGSHDKLPRCGAGQDDRARQYHHDVACRSDRGGLQNRSLLPQRSATERVGPSKSGSHPLRAPS